MSRANYTGLGIAAVFVFLTGCGGQGVRSQSYWDNASLQSRGVSPQQYEATFRGNMGECRGHSARVAESAYPTQQRSPQYQTEIDGSVNGKPFYGTARTVPQQQADGNVGMLAGYKDAVRSNQRQQLVEDTFNGCMADKGWLLVRK